MFGNSLFGRQNRKALHSFTLVELLVVIGIIAILASLTLAASGTVWTKAARARASSEIAAMSTALESYKVDNGIYPPSTNLYGPPSVAYPLNSSVAGGTYQVSSQIIYQNLSGQVNFLDDPVSGTKVYMSFKANQLGNAKTAKGTSSSATSATYVKDPWGYSYGYSTGGTASTYYPYNGSGFFDLWSTGGVLADKGTIYATNTWVGNWN